MSGEGAPELPVVDAAGLMLGVVAARWHTELVDHMQDRAVCAARACRITDVIIRGSPL